jgi:hypothetical protein
LLLSGCGGVVEQRSYPPLRYNYLLPLRLNVSTIQIEQRFVPSGVPPDVTPYDPLPPVQALRAMADDRLQALGSADLAVFVIQDASLVRHGDTIVGRMAAELDIFNAPNARVAYAQAIVTATYTGDLDDLAGRLYDMTKDMMTRMNVEFEYQVRRSLSAWLLTPGAPESPVQQQPLTPPEQLPAPEPELTPPP